MDEITKRRNFQSLVDCYMIDLQLFAHSAELLHGKHSEKSANRFIILAKNGGPHRSDAVCVWSPSSEI